jgi:putative transposase
VAVAELAGELREGLLALAVEAGMQVLAALMEDDVTAVCGRRGGTIRSGRRPDTATSEAR